MNMVRYKNLGGNSNVHSYCIATDHIVVQFNSGNPYTYSYNSAGRDKVETMKKLAVQGQGLNSYIMRYARYDYEK